MEGIFSFRNEYYFLSNFYEAPVVYNNITYNNNEAAFQAQKCINEKDKQQFSALNPSEAKKLGKRVDLRKDWEDVKVSVMREVVKAKFDQNEDLKELLLETGTMHLKEGNTWGDKIWGTVNGTGSNLLGNILMELRENYRNYFDTLNEMMQLDEIQKMKPLMKTSDNVQFSNEQVQEGEAAAQVITRHKKAR